MKNFDSGREGENLAAGHYENLGYRVIGRNVRLHQNRQVGEVDLIVVNDAARPKEIVFVEVKARTNAKFGVPADAVNFAKQKKLVRAVKLYLLQRPQYDSWNYRIDVAEVDLAVAQGAAGVDKSKPSVIILANVIEDY